MSKHLFYLGDCLSMLQSIRDESVDLIITDPPFRTGRDFGAYLDRWEWSEEINEEFKFLSSETIMFWPREPSLRVAAVINLARNNHSESMGAFCCFLGLRILSMPRVLKQTGSIYLQCDPTANSYIRLLMDAVFGRDNMRNEIVWCYTGPGTNKMKQFSRKHDTIYWYSKSKTEWTFNSEQIRIPYKNGAPAKGGWGMTEEQQEMYSNRGKTPETWWVDIPVVSRNRNQITGYPTQKPLKLLERIITASSNENDTILDPFMGSGTTIEAANKLGRNGIGIDINPDAISIAEKRIVQSSIFS